MSYEININTVALLPYKKIYTKVIETNNEYVIKKNVLQIIDDSCNYYGSSYEGRLKGAKTMLGSVYKAPIIVEDTNNIIFFPVVSQTLEDNCWFSLNNILSITKNRDKAIVYYEKGKKIDVKIPYYSLTTQISRSRLLDAISKNRKYQKKEAI